MTWLPQTWWMLLTCFLFLLSLGLLILYWIYGSLRLKDDRCSALHRCTQSDATKIRDTLVDIGQRRGGAAQFSYVRKISPYAFEELVLTCLERQGYRVKRSARYSGDQGEDGRVFFNGQWHKLQMKRYSKHINSAHVEAFVSCCAADAMPGLFIHTGRTGPKARQHETATIKIISGRSLLHFLGLDGQ